MAHSPLSDYTNGILLIFIGLALRVISPCRRVRTCRFRGAVAGRGCGCTAFPG
jgi:hypothetical protein